MHMHIYLHAVSERCYGSHIATSYCCYVVVLRALENEWYRIAVHVQLIDIIEPHARFLTQNTDLQYIREKTTA